MEEPWNNAKLQPPPQNTFLLTENEIDLTHLLNTLRSMIGCLQAQKSLHTEGAILSRLIYVYDLKFRQDIGYSYLKRTNVALRRYLKLNLLNDTKVFYDFAKESTNDNCYPSRQLLEYLLIRLLSFSKLMARVMLCSKKSAIIYFDSIKKGCSYWMSVLPYATLCRVWSLCRVLLNDACSWYSKLHKYICKFKLVGTSMLSKTNGLPESLEKWIGIDDIDECGKFNWNFKQPIQVVSILSDMESDDIETPNFLQYVYDIRNENIDGVSAVDTPTSPIADSYENVKISDLDLGEVIARETIAKPIKAQSVNFAEQTKSFVGDVRFEGQTIQRTKTSTNEVKVPKPAKIKLKNQKDFLSNQSSKTDRNSIKSKLFNSQNMTLPMISNKIELKTLIAKEDKLRNSNNKQSMTQHLSFMQWTALKTSITQLLRSNKSEKIVMKKFKSIWNEKCQDYL